MKLPFRPLSKKFKELRSDAEKVFEGVIFDIYQWDQQMFDGSIARFDRLKRPDTVVIIQVIDNKILLAEEQQPDNFSTVDLPMGRVNRDESVKDAALRELKEETGVTPKRLYYVNSEKPESKIDWLIHTFISIGIESRTELKLDSGEKIKVIELTVDQYIDLIIERKVESNDLFLSYLLKSGKEELKQMLLHPEKYFDEVDIN